MANGFSCSPQEWCLQQHFDPSSSASLVTLLLALSSADENHTAAAAAESSRLLDVPRYHCEGTESPYQTGQLHPAIRVADLLQHINLMKTSDSYGFKEEYEVVCKSTDFCKRRVHLHIVSRPEIAGDVTSCACKVC